MGCMTQDEAMLKLLALEPEREDRILLITGWPHCETMACLARLERAGAIASVTTMSGIPQFYVPGSNDEAVLQRIRKRHITYRSRARASITPTTRSHRV